MFSLPLIIPNPASESRTQNGVIIHFEFLMHWRNIRRSEYDPSISQWNKKISVVLVFTILWHMVALWNTRISNLNTKSSFVDVGEIFGYFLLLFHDLVMCFCGREPLPVLQILITSDMWMLENFVNISIMMCKH